MLLLLSGEVFEVLATVLGLEGLLTTLLSVVNTLILTVFLAALLSVEAVSVATPGELVYVGVVSLVTGADAVLVHPVLVHATGLHVVPHVVGSQGVTAPDVLEGTVGADRLGAALLLPVGLVGTTALFELFECLGVDLAVLGLVGLGVLQEVVTAQSVGGTVLAAQVGGVGQVAQSLELVATGVHGATLLGLDVVAESLGLGEDGQDGVTLAGRVGRVGLAALVEQGQVRERVTQHGSTLLLATLLVRLGLAVALLAQV